MLVYLALAERPVGRTQLASLLFADADDPRGALRWTLAQLRRALGVADALSGDPVELGLPASAVVDVLSLASGDPDPALVRGELLEGVEPGGGADFEAWLRVERRRFAGVCEGVLRDAALAELAAGDALEAAALASRAVVLNRFDDSAHELLVRCLARAGEVAAARDHADACDVLFRRELGRAPDPKVRRAADADAADSAPAAGDRAAAVGQLEAGRAAVDAGAIDPGVAVLRQACAEARGVGDPALLARVLAALGAALVHSVRGGDQEGAAVLHEALALAEEVGDREVCCKVCRELGYVATQAGHGVSAGRWLARAATLAEDDRERAAVLSVRGKALSDRAYYEAAITLAVRLGRDRAPLRRRPPGGVDAGPAGPHARCCAASSPRRSRRSTSRSRWWPRRAGSRSSRSPRRCAQRRRCARASSTRRSPCSTTRSRSAAASATRAGRRSPPARAGSSTRRRASAPWP